MSALDILTAGLAVYGCSTEPAETLARYGALLLEGNQSLNLTAITDPEEVARRHMLDCAGVLGAAQWSGRTLLDLGTGAGFPGLVLKICAPDLSVTLLDSLQKRIVWLEQTCQILGIRTECVHGRAEELGRDPAWREKYDFVTARAVAQVRVLCELALPLLKVGGVFLAMKSDHCAQEILDAGRAIEVLGGQLLEPYPYSVPDTDLHRSVIRIRKAAPTPEKYPRRYARIQKDPL